MHMASNVFLLLTPLLILATLPPPAALSLNFTYNPMGNAVKQNLGDKGNVSYNPTFVELTWFESNPSQSAGRIYNREPLSLWDSATNQAASFNCSFSFSIVRIDNTMPADGLAFFLLNPSLSELPEAAKGYWMGLLNATTNNTASAGIIAVEFDTYFNHFDPNGNHVGIDINSINSANYSNLSFVLPDSLSVFGWVDYSSSEYLLEVYATNLSSTKPSSPLVSYSIDLAKFLPESVFIGFSAATGAASEYHRINSWSFNSTSIQTNSLAPTPQAQPILVLPSNHKKGSQVGLIAGLISAGIFVTVVVFLLFGLRIHRRRKRQRSDQPMPSTIDLRGLPTLSNVGYGPRMFNYRELREATDDFHEDSMLGEGGFGSVYRGVIPIDGSEIAVKCISQKSTQGEKEFFAEVSIISRIRHKNLVQLRGWCREKSNLLLVYEYLPKGSLDRYLFSERSSLILDWSKRYNIVCGLGLALQYLHEECERVIVHRDIKASNVMLDTNYNAKLGDFGLARQLGEGMEGHTTLAAGTVGYMAPETYTMGRATTNSDVYSYGIVLLEVVSGCHPLDNSMTGRFVGSLLDWVWDLNSKGKLTKASDARLQGAFDEEQLVRTVTVALACAHPDPKLRPPIRLALEALQGRVPLPTIPTFKPVAYYGPPPSKSLLSPSTTSSFGNPISSSSSAPDTDMSEKALLH